MLDGFSLLEHLPYVEFLQLWMQKFNPLLHMRFLNHDIIFYF